VAAVALVVAGCGGGKKSDTTTVQTTHVQVTGHAANGFDAASLYKQLAPGVVTVISIFPGSPNPLSGGGGGGEEGLGSGFVLDGNGYIATNAHVIATGDRVPLRKASQVYVEFADGNRVPAKIVGYDPNADVGVVKIDPGGL
jgi:S1-C subfamily serine protease